MKFAQTFCSLALAASTTVLPAEQASSHQNLSLYNEVQHAIDKGIAWLKTQQAKDGTWSDAEAPAVTALALTACMGQPSGELRKNPPEFVQRGYDALLRYVKPDGGIYHSKLQNYNTSLALLALAAAHQPKFDPLIRRAREFVITEQIDLGEPGKLDHPMDGGIGYGQSADRSDMSNTLTALEALYYSKDTVRDLPKSDLKELNWPAVIEFIQRCQNLPSHNKQPWASADPQNKGGFVYSPEKSEAAPMTLPNGRIALRSYGSISYAGLLSYIYADVRRDDPRVIAVVDWLRKNFTLDENPALGPEGLYYYYHTMAKALSAYDADQMPFAGKEINWREGLAKKLLNLQHKEGFWVNENGRWWEKDPVLVTAYSLIALEYVARGL